VAVARAVSRCCIRARAAAPMAPVEGPGQAPTSPAPTRLDDEVPTPERRAWGSWCRCTSSQSPPYTARAGLRPRPLPRPRPRRIAWAKLLARVVLTAPLGPLAAHFVMRALPLAPATVPSSPDRGLPAARRAAPYSPSPQIPTLKPLSARRSRSAWGPSSADTASLLSADLRHIHCKRPGLLSRRKALHLGHWAPARSCPRPRLAHFSRWPLTTVSGVDLVRMAEHQGARRNVLYGRRHCRSGARSA
jgi:hypothetical protein